MQGYTPVFGSVYAGTLCGKWPAAAVWVSLLPLCDKRGHIDMSHAAISALTGWPLDLLKQGISELMKPDPSSRSAAEDGRRLALLDPETRDWGWRVVNHGLYREKARKAAYDSDRTASGRDAQRKKASREVPRSPDASREVPLSDSDANTDSDSDSKKPDRAAAQPEPGEFVEIRREYPKRAGSQRWHDALSAYRARVREGVSPQAILSGVRRYAAFIRATGKERTEHVQQAATFLGKNRGFELPWHPPAKPETPGQRLMRTLNGDDNSRVIEHAPEFAKLPGH